MKWIENMNINMNEYEWWKSYKKKKKLSLLAPFWIEKLQDLAGLIFVLVQLRSSSSLLRSLVLQAAIWRMVVTSFV